MAYTTGTGIDEPLSAIRFGYNGQPPIAIIPHADWRGQMQRATTSNGADASITVPDIPWVDRRVSNFLNNQTPREPLVWVGDVFEGHQNTSGLLYRRNRMYDPVAGRFTQEDPIGLAGGLNLYGYAGGDPVNYSDPLGLCPEGVQADSARQTGKKQTTLWCADGSTEVRSGGTWAWRNNNPGNIAGSNLATRGRSGGFSVFANRTVGNEAMWRQHVLDADRGLTLAEMITKYAPPGSNNTAAYIAAVSRASGVALNTRLDTLTEVSTWAIIRAMQQHEGWQEGTLTITHP